MRIPLSIIMMLSAGFLASAGAQEPSETDRLRDALRSATSQTRALEDQRNALQAKLTQTERNNAALKSQLDAAKAEVRQVKKDYRKAVTEFNERLEERNQTLEKWKEAYNQAATVARTKDAERAKFEAEANTYKENTKVCTAKNKELASIGKELLVRYESVTFGDAVLAQEPLTGIRRARMQGVFQDYDEKIQSHSFQR